MSLPRYPKYKDSGVEWLGEVPEHWERRQLKTVASISYGIGEPPPYKDEGIPLIRATNVNAGRITPEGLVCVDPNDIPAKRIVWLQTGDIIVVRSGAYTGDSAIILDEHVPCIAGFDMVLRARGCLPKFVQYVLLSSYMKDAQIDLERMRAAQPHLNAEELGSCFLLLPPLEDQIRVMVFLDRETAKIDALIAEQERLIELLKEKRRAVISHAVTKGLNSDAPMNDSGVEWIGKAPAHWDVQPLKYVSKMKGRLGWQGLRADEYTEDGPFLVTSEHFTNDQIDWNRCYHVSPERYAMAPEIQLRDCDLLIMKDGAAMGKLAYVDCLPGAACLNSHLLLFRPLNGRFENRFLYYVLGGQGFRTYMHQTRTGTTFFGISQESIGSFTFALPPISEQRQILDFLNREMFKIDELTSEATRAIDLLQERRTALISAAVTGKIDVRGQAKGHIA